MEQFINKTQIDQLLAQGHFVERYYPVVSHTISTGPVQAVQTNLKIQREESFENGIILAASQDIEDMLGQDAMPNDKYFRLYTQINFNELDAPPDGMYVDFETLEKLITHLEDEGYKIDVEDGLGVITQQELQALSQDTQQNADADYQQKLTAAITDLQQEEGAVFYRRNTLSVFEDGKVSKVEFGYESPQHRIIAEAYQTYYLRKGGYLDTDSMPKYELRADSPFYVIYRDNNSNGYESRKIPYSTHNQISEEVNWQHKLGLSVARFLADSLR